MKKRFLAILLALVMVLAMLPATAFAAEDDLPDWYFLVAIFKNVDVAECKNEKGEKEHAKYTITQDEIDYVQENIAGFEEFMSSFGVMRTHIDVVEIDTPITELDEWPNGKGWYESWLSERVAPRFLEGEVDLDKYDHVFAITSLNVSTSYLGLTGGSLENGTGYSGFNLENRDYCLNHLPETQKGLPFAMYVHEFLHFMATMNKKWGAGFDLHAKVDEYNGPDFSNGKTCYTDIILNQAKGDAGTGVYPIAWQYPPHVLRTMCEWTVPSGVTSIGDWAFGYCTALTKVSIPASIVNIDYAAFYNTSINEVYYEGTEAEWKAIKIGEFNETLTNATIHYNSTGHKQPAITFADVPDTEWYAEPVTWAVEKGITNGTSDTTFSPKNVCTHDHVLTFLWRAAGKPASTAQLPFTPKNAWAADALRWAYEKKMIGASFNEEAACTRADAVTYIWQAFDSPASAGTASFTDVPAGASYATAVAWAVGKEITNGTTATTFEPNKSCDRGTIVTFLYRAYKN